MIPLIEPDEGEPRTPLEWIALAKRLIAAAPKPQPVEKKKPAE